MELDVVRLAQDIIAIPSVSRDSNVDLANLLAETLRRLAFEVEWLEYADDTGKRKASLVARLGEGAGGLVLFSHADTVPGDNWGARDPFQPTIAAGRLIGLGACDMKGPLAATIAAAARFEAGQLRRPLYLAITSDEEANYLGARQVVNESALLRRGAPPVGVVCEPTRLHPVYAHKGGILITVIAHGKAAHTSTEQGLSANFLIAPFLAEMAELAKCLKTDEAYMNHEFDPPTLGFNMTLSDGDCRPNVTAAQTVCRLSLRPMPNDRSDEVVQRIVARAQAYGFEIVQRKGPPFYTAPDAAIVQAAARASGRAPMTVPFGTEATVYASLLQPVVLGPGDIAQAHTVGEWIDLHQLREAVAVYARLIETFCLDT